MADYGLWVGSVVRGELSAARANANGFLADVRGDDLIRPDAEKMAHRAAGINSSVRRRPPRSARLLGTSARPVPAGSETTT